MLYRDRITSIRGSSTESVKQDILLQKNWRLIFTNDSGLARPQSAPCWHYYEVMNLWREEFQLKITTDSIILSKLWFIALHYVSLRDHFRCRINWPIKCKLPAVKLKKTSSSVLAAVAAGVRSNPDQVNRLPEIRKEAEGETKPLIRLLVGRKSSRESEWGHGWVHFHPH